MNFGKLKILSGLTFGSVLAVFILILLADKGEISKQDFDRKFNQEIIHRSKEIKVEEDSYVAGLTTRNLYIGNLKHGVSLLQVDLRSMDREQISIQIDDRELSHPHIRIDSPNFFVSDGHKAALYSGRLENWTTRRSHRHLVPFIDAQVISPSSTVLRAINSKDENAIVKISDMAPHQTISKDALMNQSDGLYSTAGALHYSRFKNKIIYVYYFRNEYILLDTMVNLYAKGKTIDTVSVANVNALQLTDDTYTLAAPLQMVNKCSFVFRDYLFICSVIMGSNDEEQIFRNSNTIDIYCLADLRYLMSFRVPDYEDQKLKSFYIREGVLVGCYRTRIVVFNLDTKKIDHNLPELTVRAIAYKKDILLAGEIPASLVEGLEP